MHKSPLKEQLLLQQKKGKINDVHNRDLILKTNAPFTACIAKISNVLIGNLEDLDIVMPMYNLTEYSKNYKKQQAACGIITGMNQLIQ